VRNVNFVCSSCMRFVYENMREVLMTYEAGNGELRVLWAVLVSRKA
jgi:hypothetical protein